MFLLRARSGLGSALLPSPENDFYRPISQGVYFVGLQWMGPRGAVAAHVIHLGLLALCVILLVHLTSRLAGRRAALFAGIAFAALGAAPSLVAWVSCVQDLLAISFLLGALCLRDSGRHTASLALAAGALLSKETAVLFFPALVLWDWIRGRRQARPWYPSLAFIGLAVAWAVAHPGIRKLVALGFRREALGYVGLEPTALGMFHATRYAKTLLNVPITGLSTPWRDELTALTIAGLVLVGAGVWLVRRRSPAEEPSQSISLIRAAFLGILMAGPAVAVTSLLVRHWGSYYACLPGVGVALLAGVVLSRVPVAVAGVGLAAYLALGVWSRGTVVPGGSVWTERTFIDASRANGAVERNFRKVVPSLPTGSQVLLSVAGTGQIGVNYTMLGGQALSLWYSDPSLVARLPERRRAEGRSELLARVTEKLDVILIDPDRLFARSSGAPPDTDEVHMVLRTYARGLAASGDSERAVRILTALSRLDDGYARLHDLRLAAMVRFAEGRDEEAKRLIDGAPEMPRDLALDGIARVLGQPTERAELDSCAFPAFGFASDDPGALRYLMEIFYASDYRRQARDLALRLQAVVPGDVESADILRSLREKSAN